MPDAASFDPPALAPDAAAPAPLPFAVAEEGFGLALPSGCRYREPTVRALRRDRRLSFLSLPDDDARSLLVVEPRSDGGAAAWVQGTTPGSSLVEQAPLFDLGAPLLAHDGVRFRGLFASGPRDRRGLLLTAAPSQREVLAVGDSAAAFDFRCQHGFCAALTTRLGRVASRGASVLVGRADSNAPQYRRIDLEDLTGQGHPSTEGAPGDDGPTALTIASVRGLSNLDIVTGTHVDVVVHELAASSTTETDRSGGVSDTIHGPLPAAFGALDTTLLHPRSPTRHETSRSSARAVAITHGARVEGLCATPRPLGRIVREGLPPIDLPLSAPLHTALVRPLDVENATAPSAVLVYSAALRCHDDRRRFVTVQLLDESGAPRGPSMVVGEATGFAVRADGADVDLALMRADDVAIARLRCDGS